MNENSASSEMSVNEAERAIVLSTLNARYIHASFGLRYLKANLGELEDACVIEEFTLDSRPADIVESLLKYKPAIVGFGIYIWNVRETERVVAMLKAVAPHVKVVLGGPEVSYEQAEQRIIGLADYVISGWGEVTFTELATGLLNGDGSADKYLAGMQPALSSINMPYRLYDDEDIRNRVLYVEASRGCPFKCEFCLSALDKTAWPFDLDQFLEHMDVLYQRGARHFKFVDRTFNLKIKNSIRILDFFLERMTDGLFLHFEVVPDHLPEALKEMIVKFPPQSLQFEIGIQSFNPEVQSLISRKQDNIAAAENIHWILTNSEAYVHADLIFGLPGDTLDSFASSFDRLYQLQPHEIQVGILKRLKGSPIIRHVDEFGLIFNPEPPFNIVASKEFDFVTVQRISRFARFWDLIGNSGRFRSSLPLLLADQPFDNFLQLSDAIFAATGQTHKISLLRLFDLVFNAAVESTHVEDLLAPALEQDFARSGLKSLPKFLQSKVGATSTRRQRAQHASRQARH